MLPPGDDPHKPSLIIGWNARTSIQSGNVIFASAARDAATILQNNFIEEKLGISASNRNWSTVTKIVEWVRKKANG
jgi:uncharacterized protein (DUF1697 family)